MSWSKKFRNFIKRHTSSKTEQQAIYWTNRFSSLYIFFAWNAAGIGLATLIWKYKQMERDEKTLSRAHVDLERALAWGNFTSSAKISMPKPKLQEDTIEESELKQ